MKTLCDIQPGQTVGRYEFLLPIAQGGMAAVWAARLKGSRGFSKLVAVKTMLPGFSDEPQFQQMFLDEARIASRIRHPHVVEIHDLGEQDDILYLVMELVDGQSLSELRAVATRRGDIPLPVAVKIVGEASAGLHAAHELRDEYGEHIGLVHRDISPQNLLISYEGVVKIVDFGVAKAAGRTSDNTSAGHVKGKPPYMSPEQAMGQSVDRRTDVFALGIVLYQITAGRHPLRGETDLATLHNIVSDRPIVPPSEVVPKYPRALERVVLKALARDPNRRFQTARELELALEDAYGPDLPRTRAGDVGHVVTTLLGTAGAERRAAIREAIRLADQRALAASVGASGMGRTHEANTVVAGPPSGVGALPSNAAQSQGAGGLGHVEARRSHVSVWRITAGVAATTGIAVAAVVLGGGLLSQASGDSPATSLSDPPMPRSSVTALSGDAAAGAGKARKESGEVLPPEPSITQVASGPTIDGGATPLEHGDPLSRTPQGRSSARVPKKQPDTMVDTKQGKGGGGDPDFVPPPIPNPGF